LKKRRAGKIVLSMFSHFTVYVVYTEDFAKAAKEVPGLDPLTEDEATASDGITCAANCRNPTYIFLKPSAGPGTKAHEAWHAVENLREFIHEKNMSEETTAYVLGYIVEGIHHFGRAKKTKKPAPQVSQ
jgi:hypothetical protein